MLLRKLVCFATGRATTHSGLGGGLPFVVWNDGKRQRRVVYAENDELHHSCRNVHRVFHDRVRVVSVPTGRRSTA